SFPMAIVAIFLTAAGVRAQVAIPVHFAGSGAVRVDGSARDWASVRRIDLGSGDDASMMYSLAEDRDALYLLAEVRDERIIRSPTAGGKEDAVVLTFASPNGPSHEITQVWLAPGIAGQSKAVARVSSGGSGAPRATRDVQVVEGPLEGGRGYVIEARIPWRILAGSTRRDAARIGLGLVDVDGEASRR